MDKRKYIQQLADEAHDTVNMLSSHRKSERERRVCAAFLRCLGLDFSPDEVATPKSDPPDVVFRDARFEIMMVLDEGRKMHADWKSETKKRDAAKSLDDLGDPYQPTIAMAPLEVVNLITAELARKSLRYGQKTCSALDALVYINLRQTRPFPVSNVVSPAELRSQGWRSVSYVFSPYSHVIFAPSNAPEFLHQNKGQTKQECKNPDVIFEL